MDNDPRRKWAISSGLTRREQQILIFLIVVVAAGLAYEQYRGGWRRESLVLHRGATDKAGQPSVAGAAARPTARVRQSDAATTPVATLPLDINKASVAELETLPGIGPVRAAAIVRYRETHGPFKRIEDLRQVSGIGEKTLEAIRLCLKPLDGPATISPAAASPRGKPPLSETKTADPAPPTPLPKVNLNTATIEELDTLDGIGQALAQRIIEYRQLYGPFRTPADIQKVRGIGPGIYQKNRERLTVGNEVR
jgi:competence protein ComEA